MAINFSTFNAPLFRDIHAEYLAAIWDSPLQWELRPQEIVTALLFDALEARLRGWPRARSVETIARLQKVSPSTVYRHLTRAWDWARDISDFHTCAQRDWEASIERASGAPPLVHHHVSNMVAV